MRKYVIEMLGTAFLLFTILYTNHFLWIGLALALIVFLGGPISGGHFNPAVSIMMVFNNKLPSSELIPYIIAQVVGALFVVVFYKYITTNKNK